MSSPTADLSADAGGLAPAETTAQRHGEYASIALVGFAHGSSHFFQLLLAPLFPWLMLEFGLNFTQVGLAMTLFFTLSGFGQTVAGFAVDRFGPARVLMFGESCLVLAALVLALTPHYAGIYLAAAFAGCGNAVYHPAGFTVLNRRVTGPRLGHAFAVHGLSGNLGWALAPALLTGVATFSNWRMAAFSACGVALLALLVLIGKRRLLEVPLVPVAERGERASTFDFLRVPAVWLCFGFFFFITMAFGAFQNFSAPLLENLYGMSLAAGASALTVYLLCGAFGVFVGGFLAARGEGHDRRIALILSAAALLAVLLASGVLPAVLVPVLMGVIGFCNGLAGPSRDLMVRRAAMARFGQAAFGRIYGLVYSGLDAGMALSPLVFGLFMDAKQFALVLLGVALMQIFAVLTALSVGRQQRATSTG